MKEAEQLKKAIKEIAESGTAFVFAEVKSVDKNNMTCVCEDALGNQRIKVRLRANVENPDGFMLIPKVGSSVLLGVLTANQYFVAMTSQVESVLFIQNKETITLDAKGFSVDLYKGKIGLKNSQEDLKAILSDLIIEIGKITVSNGAGVTGFPLNKPVFDKINQRLTKLLN